MIRQALKATTIGSMIGGFLVHSFAVKPFLKDPVRRKDYFMRNASRYAKIALKVLNIEVQVRGFDPRQTNENFLLVSNHMSYTDVMALSAVMPNIFITSVDMGEVFLLGSMAEMGGSIFVERRDRSQVGRDLSAMTRTLSEGFSIALYPEGTSSNGETVLPFKKSLLMAAPEAGKRILPMTLKYTEINGEPFSEKNRDLVCWYGDMRFGSHFLNLAGLESVKVELTFHEPIATSVESTRDELAAKTYQAIADHYHGRPPVFRQDSVPYQENFI